jgi:hypothetical protein
MNTQLIRLFAVVCLGLFAGYGIAIADEPTPEPAPASNDDTTYELTYKLKLGDVLRFKVDHRASVRSTIEGTTQTVLTHTESVKAWKVTDVLPSGQIEFVNLVEQVKMRNKLADRAEMIYDSKVDKEPPAGWEDVAASVGQPLSVIHMSPRGEVIAREVKYQQPAADSEAPIALLLPGKPVKVGDTWEEPRTASAKLQDGATRDLKARRLYKLLEVTDGIAHIEVTYQVLSPMDPVIESQLVQRMMKGIARFDIARGRPVGQSFEIDRRVLGFAGPTSTMHYLMKMEEKLEEGDLQVAARPEE